MPLVRVVAPEAQGCVLLWARALADALDGWCIAGEAAPDAEIHYYLPYTAYRGRVSRWEAALIPPFGSQTPSEDAFVWTVCASVDLCICMDPATQSLLEERGIAHTTVVPCMATAPGSATAVLRLGVANATGEDAPWAELEETGVSLCFPSFDSAPPAFALPSSREDAFFARVDWVLAPDDPATGPHWALAALAHGRRVIAPARDWAVSFPHAAYRPGEAGNLKRLLRTLVDENRGHGTPQESGRTDWQRAHEELFADWLAAAAEMQEDQPEPEAAGAVGVWWDRHMTPTASARASAVVAALLHQGVQARAVERHALCSFGGATVYAAPFGDPGEALRFCDAARRLGKRVVVEKTPYSPETASSMEQAALRSLLCAADHVLFAAEGELAAVRECGARVASWNLLPSASWCEANGAETVRAELSEECAQALAAAVSKMGARLGTSAQHGATDILYVDVTASAERMRKDLPPSGIPRVEYLIARQLPDVWAGEVRYIGWHATRRAWIPISHAEFFADAHAVMLTPDGDSAPRRRASHPAAMVDFIPGSTAVFMGGTWLSDVNYPAFIADLRAVKALRRVRVAACIYDVIRARLPYLYPQHLTAAFMDNLGRLLRTADLLLTDSRCAAADILWAAHKHGGSTATAQVIRLGDALPQTEASDHASEVRTALNGKPFVLCVSALDMRKNHALLWRLWRSLLDELGNATPHMVWVGSPSHNTGELLRILEADAELREYIHVYHHLDDGPLGWLYEHCLFTAYPSWYEGWGLPVAESLALGKVCLASRAASVPEIAGELTDLLHPHDFTAWRDRVLLYLLSEPARRAREAEIQRCYKRHSWAETAGEVAAILRQPIGWMPPYARIAYGQMIDFGLAPAAHAAPAMEVQLAGWSRIEQTGCWTDGAEAHFGFVVEQLHRGVTVLLVEAAPYRHEDREPVRCGVQVNGRSIALWNMGRSGVWAAPLAYSGETGGPWDVLGGFRVANPRPAAGKDNTGDAEQRALGLKVRAMRTEILAPCRWNMPFAIGEGRTEGGGLGMGLLLPESLAETEKRNLREQTLLLAMPRLAAADAEVSLVVGIESNAKTQEQFEDKELVVRIMAGERTCGAWPVAADQPWIEASFAVAREEMPSGLLTLTVWIDPADVANAAGLRPCPREGVVRPLDKAASLVPYEPGTELRFSGAHHGRAVLVRGAAAEHADGVWLSWGRSLLGVQLREVPAEGLEVFMEGEPEPAVLGRGLHIEAFANGVPFLARKIEEPGNHRISARLPRHALKTAAPLIVEFWLRRDVGRSTGAAGKQLRPPFLLRRMALRLPSGSAPIYAVGSRVVLGGGPAESFLIHGWARPQDDSRWTLGSSARFVCTPEPRPSGDAELRVKCRALVADALPEQPVRVRVNGDQVGTLRVRGGFGEHTVLIPSETLRKSDALTVDLEVTMPRSPAQLGLGDDTRQLGILVHWLSLTAAAEKKGGPAGGEMGGAMLQLARPVFLGEGGLPEGAFERGWSAPQDESRWTVGPSAQLAVRVDAGSHESLLLAAEARAFTGQGQHSQTVVVRANGQELGRWEVGSELAAYGVRMPRSILHAGGRLVLELGPQRPVSPKSLGLGPDTRELGVLVRRLVLTDQAHGQDLEAVFERAAVLSAEAPAEDAGDPVLPIAFGKGWSTGKEGVRTMTAREAEISVTAPADAVAALELVGSVGLAQPAKAVFARIQIYAGDALAGAVLAFDAPRTCRCLFPQELLEAGKPLTIRLCDTRPAMAADSDAARQAGAVTWEQIRVVTVSESTS